MYELRVKRTSEAYVIQACVETGWRRLVRNLGLKFIAPRYVWRTLRRDNSILFPVIFSPYGTGYILKFNTYKEAEEQAEAFRSDHV